jgi:hypothetical protein
MLPQRRFSARSDTAYCFKPFCHKTSESLLKNPLKMQIESTQRHLISVVLSLYRDECSHSSSKPNAPAKDATPETLVDFGHPAPAAGDALTSTPSGCGPKDGDRVARVKGLPPIAVGLDGQDLPAVVHRVKE